MFDQFGGVEVREHDGRVEGLVNFLHRADGALGGDTHDDAVRFHQVLDRGTFAQEFGIAHHINVRAGIAAADGLGHFFTGLDRDGAFVHDDAVFLDVDGDFAGDAFDKAQIDAAVGLRRGWNGDEDHLGSGDGLADGGRKGEPARRHVLFHQFFQARFVDGDEAVLKLVDFFKVVIHANHPVAHFGKASACDQPDVTRPDNCKIHKGVLCPCRRRRASSCVRFYKPGNPGGWISYFGKALRVRAKEME